MKLNVNPTLLERAVAHELCDSAVMLCGPSLAQFSAMDLKLHKRPGFAGSHEPTISDHIGQQV